MATASVGKLHSKHETARQLGISIATLDRLIAAGRIEYYKVSDWLVRFSDEQINSYLERARNAPRRRHPARAKKTARQRVRKAA